MRLFNRLSVAFATLFIIGFFTNPGYAQISILPSSAVYSGAQVTYRMNPTQDSIIYRLEAYYGCQTVATMPDSLLIFRFTTSCGNTTSYMLKISDTDVSDVCAASLPFCANPGGLTGERMVVYERAFDLSNEVACGVQEVLTFNTDRRDADNIDNTGQTFGDRIRPRVSLMLGNDSLNSSPQIAADRRLFVCKSTNVSFNPQVTDADGDSLVYSLIGVEGGGFATSEPFTYEAGFSAADPTGNGFSMDSETGIMSFTAPDSGVYQVVMQVQDYDPATGNLLSTVFRDFQIAVDSTCSNVGPTVAGSFSGMTNISSSTTNTIIVIDTGAAASWSLDFTGAGGETVAITTTAESAMNGAVASSSIVSNTTTHTVNWTPTGADIGTYVYSIGAEDDGCDIQGKTAHKVTVIVQGSATPFEITNISTIPITCPSPPNGGLTATFTGGNGPYMFAVLGNFTGFTDTNATGVFNSLVFDVYRVYAIDSSTMNDTLTGFNFLVAQNTLGITSVTTQSTVSCDDACDGAMTVNHTGGNSPYTYSWSQLQSTKSVNGLCGGDVRVTVTDNSGCAVDTAVTLFEPPAVFGTVDSTNVVTCNGGNDGEAYVSGHGGVASSTTTATYIIDQTEGAYENYPYTRPVNSSGFQSFTLLDDALSGSVGIGFSFDFFGSSVTTFQVSSNGNIQFPGATSAAWQNTTIPTAGAPNNWVGIWDDLNPNADTNERIETYLMGTTPNRVRVINYVNVPHFNENSARFTFQIVLYETSNIIQIHALNVPIPGSQGGAPGTTQGIENATGTFGYAVSGRNSTSWSATNDYVAFIPTNQNFSYSWSSIGSGSSSTSLTAGNYTVTVENGTCTDTVQFSIAEPPAIVIDTTLTSPLCNGDTNGQIVVSASGGNGGPFTFAWNTGATGNTLANVGAGTYTVTATDASACTEALAITLTEPSVVSVSIAVDSNVSCFGGSNGQLTATGAGGTPGYSYAWSGGGGNNATASNLAAGTYTVTVTDNNGCTATASQAITQPGSAVAASIVSSTNVSCVGGNDGAATAQGAGGTPGYSFIWSNLDNTATTSGLTAGTYSVTVTDNNGCTDSSTVTITEPANGVDITINSVTHVLCNGDANGSITANAATGGTGPYTYAWTGGGSNLTKSGLSAGTYTITVTDAGGCTDTASATVTEPAVLAVDTVSTSAPSCAGASDGSITVAASGGTAGYSYAWNGGGNLPTKSGLSAGTHTVTVTDANTCTATLSVTLVAPANLTVNIAVDSNVSCFGGSNGQLTANTVGGAAPLTYAWTPAGNTQTIAGLTAGNYTVTVTDANGCTGTATQSVSQPASAVSASIASSSNVSCVGGNDGSATAQGAGGTPGYSFIWSNLDNTPTTSGLTAGTYSVTVTDNNGCTDSSTVTITEPANGVDVTIASVTNVLCNGDNTGSITANAASGGTGPYTYAWTGGGSNLTKSGVTAGTYTITATDANGCTDTASATVTEPTLLTIDTTSTTQPTCATSGNGSITVAAAGGSPGYNYAWTPAGTGATINGLNAGNYTVTVTDANGCTESMTVSLSALGGITASITVNTNITCVGDSTGQLTASGSNGTAPYTFAWNNGPTSAINSNLPAATYTVTVTDANGCTDTAQATLAAPNPIVFTAFTNISEISCDDACDGAATATASGGAAPLSFAWSSGSNTATATALCGGGHTVTISDANGCSITEILGLVEPPSLSAQLDSFNHVACNGQSNGEAFIGASGGSANSTSTAAYTIDQTVGEFEPYPKGQPWNATNYQSYNLEDDETTAPIDVFGVGSAFSFFGQNKTQFAIASQGLITFDLTKADTVLGGMFSTTQTIPTAGPNTAFFTNDFIAGYWHDLYPDTLPLGPRKTTIETYVLGSAPNRVRVINYTEIDHWVTPVPSVPPPGIRSTFQIALYENSNIIQMHSDSLRSDGGGHVQGIENAAGNDGYTVTGRNNTDFEADNDYVAFIPTSQNFTYTWSSVGSGASSTNLPAGSYTVTVSDGTCSDTVEFTITEPPVLNIFANDENETCLGDSTGFITLSIPGGTPPLSFIWNTGATTQNLTGITSGTYTVTVTDANGCQDIDSWTLTPGVNINLAMDSTAASCSGIADGSAEVNPSGGGTPYTYIWSTGSTTDTIDNRPGGLYTVTVTDANGCEAIDSVTIDEGVGVTATATVTDPNCFGESSGTATGGQIGGTGPFTYTWNIGAGQTQTNLAAGSYTLTVTDGAGCSDDTTITLVNPTILDVTIIDTVQPTCANNDGELEALGTGGTGALSYTWSTTANTAQITNLPAGDYTVTVTDQNSCVDSVSITLVAPPSFTANAAMLAADTCSNSTGVATVTMTGGATPFGFVWSNSGTTQTISNLPGTTYSVTVTDANGCTDSASVAVIDTCACNLVASGVLINDVSCNGGLDGSATVQTTGGTAPLTYAWSGGGGSNDTISGVGANTYTVTVTDALGCTDTAQVTISQPANALTASITSTTAPTCFGGSDGQAVVVATNGTAPYSYAWSSLSTNDTAMNLSAGLNTVTVTDANGCTATASTTLGNGTAINVSLVQAQQSSCFNCDGEITTTVTGATGPYIYDYSSSPPINSNNSAHTLTSLCSGPYSVTVTDANGCTGTASTTVTDLFAPPLTTTPTPASCANSCDGQIVASYFCITCIPVRWYEGVDTNVLIGTGDTITGLCPGTYLSRLTTGFGCDNYDTVIVSAPSPLVSTTDSIPAGCNITNPGAAIVSVSGGTTPYSYLWSNNGTNDTIFVAGGTYTVTVTDGNGCQDTAEVTVPTTSGHTAQANLINDADCFGASTGSANATQTGGTAPYTYVWNNSSTNDTISGVPAGTYSVTITDAAGCTDSASVVIGEADSIMFTFTETPVSCGGPGDDGALTVSATGGTPPYASFSWNTTATGTTITNLTPGTYCVTVTDANGCQNSDCYTLNPPGAFTAEIIDSADVSCFGGSDGFAVAQVTSTGSGNYSYLWSNLVTNDTVTNLTAGTHFVTVTDLVSGCSDSDTVIIGTPTPLVMVIDSVDSVNCLGGSDGVACVTATGGTPPYSYAWSNSATTSCASGLPAGTYTVTVTDANLCTVTGDTIIGEPATGLIASAIEATPATCNGDSALLIASATGGNGNYTYAWPGGFTNDSVMLPAGSYCVTIGDGGACTDTACVTVIDPSLVTASATLTSPTCPNGNDGSITASGSGGNGGPYTFLWDDNSTNATRAPLTQGTYSVTVTDAMGCTGSSVFILSDPVGMSATFSNLTPTSCGSCNGAATVNVSGGTTPYTYAWPGSSTTSTGTNLCAGLNTVTVTDGSGCVDSFNINVPSLGADTVFAATIQNVTCNGGSDGIAGATYNCNNGPCSVEWFDILTNTSQGTTDTVTGLPAGDYYVELTNGLNCLSFDTITITEPTPVVATITGSTPVSCPNGNDGTATVLASGGNPGYSYSWPLGGTNPTETGLGAGNYCVTITDASGCTDTACVTIQQPANGVQVTGILISDVTCNGGNDGSVTAQASGGTGPYSLLWDGTLNTDTLFNVTAGDYIVQVTDGNGCTALDTVTVSEPLPVGGTFTNVLDPSCPGDSDGEATVTATGGTAPHTYLWPSNNTGQTETGLSDGTYCVTITDANGCSDTACVTISDPAGIVNTFTNITSSSCTVCDGTAQANPSGGNGPVFTYMWSNSQTTALNNALCAGANAVTITDAAGCTSVESVLINADGADTVIASGQDPTCGACDGEVYASYNCTQPTCTVEWKDFATLAVVGTTDTVTGLCSGTYLVELTNGNSCIFTDTVTITAPPVIDPNPTLSMASCFNACDGSIILAPTGGSGSFTYTWSNLTISTPQNLGLCAGTYTVTISDGSGCDTIDSFTITEPTQIANAVTQNNASCANVCDGSVTVATSGGAGGYSYNWNPVPGNGNGTNAATGLCAGTYFLTTTDANLCTRIDTFTITSPDAIVQDTVVVTDATCGLCDGAIVPTFSGGAGGYTFLWSNAATTDSLTNICFGAYTVTVTDASGCTAVFSYPVSETNGPDISISSTNATSSGNCDGTATVTVITSLGNVSYLWSNGDTTQTADSLCAGPVFVTVTDTNGCSTVDTVTITEPTPLILTFDVTEITCAGNGCDGVIEAEASGGVPPYTFAWSNGETTALIDTLCVGTYTLTLTDDNGNQVVDSVELVAPQPFSIASTVTDVTCPGECDGSITVTITGGDPPYTYTWNTGDTTASLTDLCSGLYSLTVNDTAGCSIALDFNVDEPDPINVVVSNITNPDCQMNNGSVTVSANGGNGAPYAYEWLDVNGDPLIPAQVTSTASNLMAGIYNVRVVDVNGCEDTSAVILNNANAADIALDSLQNVSCFGACDGSIATTISGGAAPLNILWSNGATTDDITGLCAGNDTIAVLDANLCASFDIYTITEPDELQARSIDITDVICGADCNGSISLSMTGGTTPYSFNWSNGATDSVLNDLCAGDYSVTVTDSNGCTFMTTVGVGGPDPMVITLDSIDDATCINTGDGFIGISVTGGSAPFTYRWDYQNEDTLTTQNISGVLAGEYGLTVTDANGCTVTDSFNLAAEFLVEVDAMEDLEVCPFSNGVVLAGTDSGTTSTRWLNANGTIAGNGSTVSVSTVEDTTMFVYEGLNDVCVARDTMFVYWTPGPGIDAGPDKFIEPGQSTTIGGSPTARSGVSVTWTPAKDITSITAMNPDVNPLETTLYYVSATDDDECFGVDSVRVTVEEVVDPVGGFSPNGDGVNDYFVIDRISDYPNAVVQIFNRWGNLIYESPTGYTTPWNGRYEGKELPVGTYYYVIDLHDDAIKRLITGPVTILK